MGQPGGGGVPGVGWFMPESNTYYNDCKTCEDNIQWRFGTVGKYPNERDVAVNNCKHQGSDRQAEANGACCTGYEPGWRK